MNADLEEMVAGNAQARRLVDDLRRAPMAHVAAGFSMQVMAQIRAERHASWFSASTIFAAAASIVALLAVGSIFTKSVPKADFSAWTAPELSVRLSPYNPADWYSPLACDTGTAVSAEEPLCTLKAFACLQQK